MRTLLPLLAAAALLVSACGGEDDAKQESGAAGGVIGMEGLEFVPRESRARVGQAVVWRNDEAIRHNVVATAGAGFRSPVFGEGGTFRYTPTAAGTIQYVSTLHPGMTGTLRVSG